MSEKMTPEDALGTLWSIADGYGEPALEALKKLDTLIEGCREMQQSSDVSIFVTAKLNYLMGDPPK